MRILITGGAGFVGSQLAFFCQEEIRGEVYVMDNLRRRGSETNVNSFRQRGIHFTHGDIRQREDLTDLPGNFDLVIEASAEPSVRAGEEGSPSYVIGTNLLGTLNCLEFGRRRAGSFLFLSTSRVYSISSLRKINLHETQDRFEIAPAQSLPGVTPEGINEAFPTQEPRSFYGATKLASELLIQEYAESYDLPALINRCGVVAGPGQFGKVDQGVFTLWVIHHHFGIPLQFTGFCGTGKQVRDLLHPLDLAELIRKQIDRPHLWRGNYFNVGGGPPISASLVEMTRLCREVVGREVRLSRTVGTHPSDIPLYLSDCTRVRECFGWQPIRDVRTIVTETAAWIRANESALKRIFDIPGPEPVQETPCRPPS